MHWVYILKCSNDHYYVGETTRLYRRFWEHHDGNGGINTFRYKPEEIVAIYKVPMLCNFFEYNDLVNSNIFNIYFNRCKTILDYFNETNEEDYDNLFAENSIAECLMINNKDSWKNIRGGKYTNFNIDYKFPTSEHIKHLPLCNCGLPSDIRKNEESNYLYFRCAKKNIWSDMKNIFDIQEEPCSFFYEVYKRC